MSRIPTYEEVMQITKDVSSIVLLQPSESKALYNCCAQVKKGGLVVETGCQLGRSSSLITQMAHAIGFHEIHVDPYTCQPEFLKGWVEMMHRVGGERDHAFTLLCMRTEQAKWHIERLCDYKIDVAYIDGDHEEPGVRIDLDIVAEQVKQGGYLCCHDYGAEPQPDGTMLERFPAVSRLISAYTAEGWEMVEVAHTMGVWRRK